MDIVAKVTEKMPGKAPQGQGFDVTYIEVDNDDLTIKGKAQNAAQLASIERAMGEVARPKTIAKIPTNDVPPGGTPFGFKMKVNRK
jgi:hypothetical protein